MPDEPKIERVVAEYDDGTERDWVFGAGDVLVLTAPDRYIASEIEYPGTGTVVLTIKTRQE